MKKLLLLTAVLTLNFGLLTFNSSAQTNVSGTIAANTTWAVAGSPYTVVGSITVNTGITLTVQTGVTVKFNDGTSLTVNGALNATGTTFTSSTASPARGQWSQIIFGNGTNASASTLNNCIISYGYSMPVNNNASLSATSCTFSQFSYYIFNIAGGAGTVSFTGCTMSSSNYGIKSYGAAAFTNTGISSIVNGAGIEIQAAGNITLSNSTISNCTYGINNYGTAAINAGSVISNNSSDGLVLYTASNAVLNASSITGNHGSSINYLAPANLTLTGAYSLTGNTKNYILISYSTQAAGTITWPTASIPYYLYSGVTIASGAQLTIGSNNIIKALNYGITVSGTLIANANSGEYIYFTSFDDDNWGGDSNGDNSATSPAYNQWAGINFLNSSVDAQCLINRCQIRYATQGIQTTDASPAITNCIISNNNYGVSFLNASYPVFSNNTIGSSHVTPIAMNMEADPVFTNNQFSFSDNQYDAIGIYAGTLTASATLKIRSVTSTSNVTYALLGTVTVPAGITLTIKKGIVIKTASGYNSIVIEGTLIANASADSMITITSIADDNFGHPGDTNKNGSITTPAVGDFGGIVFGTGSSSSSILNYCRIKYASPYSSFYYSNQYMGGAAVNIMNSSPTISNCIFKDIAMAIKCYQASNPVISNDSVSNSTHTPFAVSPSANPVFTGCTFTNVGNAALGLIGGNIVVSGTIHKKNVAGFTNITYVLYEDMTITNGTNITVEDGVIIKMASSGVNMYIDGGLKFAGIAGSLVKITSIKDDNVGNPFDTNGDGNATSPAGNDWGTISFRAASDDAFCAITYAEISYSNIAVTTTNASPAINHTLLNKAYYYGVFTDGNSAITIDNTIIQNCAADPVAMSLLSNPNFGSNITFQANATKAIRIIEGTLSSDATLVKRNVAGITNIAYIVGSLDIATNAKLTVMPGVVIKLSSIITVDGGLKLAGSASDKIIITVLADDSAGGDSNNDGTNSQPAAGTSSGIRFNGTSDDAFCKISNCEIRFSGGASYGEGAIKIHDASPLIDSVTIQQSGTNGIGIFGSAAPAISNCQFFNIKYEPIYMSMFANPTFGAATATNVGFMSIGIVPETYSQSATIPLRNFAGYTNITYSFHGTCTINSGTTITIPAGIVIKSVAEIYYPWVSLPLFNVDGGLVVAGTSGNPVVFTADYRDDGYGNPADMNMNGNADVPAIQGYNLINFSDVSDDASNLNYLIMRYAGAGVGLTSASPTFNNVTFQKCNTGIIMNGVSTPAINNCTFDNLTGPPMFISLVAYPSSTANNIISGTTYKMIGVSNETLSQDVTLVKRNFGGINNIPYYFTGYATGTGAVLTISPGIVTKWSNSSAMTINKGLIAKGGSTSDSTIVFTSIYDDFYGGDSNSDSTATDPNTYTHWTGISAADQSIDADVIFKYCIFRYFNKAVNTTNASPTIQHCLFNYGTDALHATGASNPVINYCDFTNLTGFAVNNVNQSFVINAKNNWWGSNTGPSVSTNPPGTGAAVSLSVDYTPWTTTGASNPLMGDVSLNGVVQAYDASLVLKSTVGTLILSQTQNNVADVSGNGTITAFDASLILQYTVGLINIFPAEASHHMTPLNQQQLLNVSMTMGDVTGSSNIIVPAVMHNANGLSSIQFVLTYDPLKLAYTGNDLNTLGFTVTADTLSPGIISIAAAMANAAVGSELAAHFNFNSISNSNTTVGLSSVLLNEDNQNDLQSNITFSATGIAANNAVKTGIRNLYPNPADEKITIDINLPKKGMVTIELSNIIGSQSYIILDEMMESQVAFTQSLKYLNLSNGMYILKLSLDGAVIDTNHLMIKQ